MSRTTDLRVVAETVAALLPAVAEEVVLTGSVSRGVADELSDVELLAVTAVPLTLEECFAHVRHAGLTGLDTWGPQGTKVSRTFGYTDGVPVELIWWPRTHAEATVDAILAGQPSAAAEALANGVALRSSGVLAVWQERLAVYPDAVAAARIEEAALAWGGFHPTGFLTLTRPGERLALVQRLTDDAQRVLSLLYALNRVWEPTTKRLASRVDALAVKPERVAERIEAALSELDPRRAMLVLTELQLDAVRLAPDGPNVVRGRRWLADVAAVLRAGR